MVSLLSKLIKIPQKQDLHFPSRNLENILKVLQLSQVCSQEQIATEVLREDGEAFIDRIQ